MSLIFQYIINLLGLYSNRFFTVKLNQKPLLPQQQFGISLGQILAQLTRQHYNTLRIRGRKMYIKAALLDNWGIADGYEAKELLAKYLDGGDREYYNHVISIFLETEGDISRLTGNGKYEYYDYYFSNLYQILKMREGKYWFPNPEKDFLVKCDGFDIGRMIQIVRQCYTVGYIKEEDAWKYISEYSKLASYSFRNWEDYAKSYLLGRAVWNGNKNVDFREFSKLTKKLLKSKNSPWVKYGWQKKDR